MKTKLFLIIIVLSGTFSFAQTKVADKFFENFAYIKASELYEDAVKKIAKKLKVLKDVALSALAKVQEKGHDPLKWQKYMTMLKTFVQVVAEY